MLDKYGELVTPYTYEWYGETRYLDAPMVHRNCVVYNNGETAHYRLINWVSPKITRIQDRVDYILGHHPANYPLLAIPTHVVFKGEEYMYDTMYIEELTIDIDGTWCPDHIVCLWDWNFDRCMDFSTPHGEMQMFFHDRLKSHG